MTDGEYTEGDADTIKPAPDGGKSGRLYHSENRMGESERTMTQKTRVQAQTQDDPYEAGTYDNKDLGDACCQDGCDYLPAGWCKTCERAHGWPEGLCIGHLVAHCTGQQHIAWVMRLRNTDGYLKEQYRQLCEVAEALDQLCADVHALDNLQARGYLSLPKRDQNVNMLAAIGDMRDQVAKLCEELHESGQSLRHRYQP